MQMPHSKILFGLVIYSCACLDYSALRLKTENSTLKMAAWLIPRIEMQVLLSACQEIGQKKMIFQMMNIFPIYHVSGTLG